MTRAGVSMSIEGWVFLLLVDPAGRDVLPPFGGRIA